ncbi:hypothetical protein BTH160X_170035 [Brochothrix thermosphacta]|nr:hypothetical protein BTH160X_170035 [Brochothrix thermosphacta]
MSLQRQYGTEISSEIEYQTLYCCFQSTKPYIAVFRVPILMLLFSEYQTFAFIVTILFAYEDSMGADIVAKI